MMGVEVRSKVGRLRKKLMKGRSRRRNVMRGRGRERCG